MSKRGRESKDSRGSVSGFGFRVLGSRAGVHERLLDAEKDVRFPRRTCHRCGMAPFSEDGAGQARKTSANPRGKTAPAPLHAC